ncbi:MAG: serine hydrolase domain-containing protein [Sphingomicrobium sp.]
MNYGIAAILAGGFVFATGAAAASSSSGSYTWPTCGQVTEFPAKSWGAEQPAGWDEAKLSEARNLWETLDSAAVTVVHQGRPVALWGDVDRNYTAQSVRKALLNSLVGIAVSKRKLALDDTLEELGIDDTRPALTQEERQATVRDLLLSRSGIFHSALYEVGGWKKLRAQLAEAKKADSGQFRPGAYWIYNNWDFNALGTVAEQALDQSIGEAFDQLVADPIGMQDFSSSNVEYTQKTDSTEQRFGNWSEHRAYMFNISTRDLARYGLLYLNCGSWNGAQVVPRDWVLASLDGVDTRSGRLPQEQDTDFGDYGYLWQIDRPGSRRLTNLKFREPVYIASGNRGHFMLVAPFLDLVIAHQVATEGGVSPEAQKRRFLKGSPNVTETDLEQLFAAIIAAHPAAISALEEVQPEL